MVGWLPRAHGSALFTRGETQAVVAATLGTKRDEQFMDDLEFGEVKRRFMLHYNFPHFSVGEVGRFGGTSRREIGHGALARRALEPVPYHSPKQRKDMHLVRRKPEPRTNFSLLLRVRLRRPPR